MAKGDMGSAMGSGFGAMKGGMGMPGPRIGQTNPMPGMGMSNPAGPGPNPELLMKLFGQSQGQPFQGQGGINPPGSPMSSNTFGQQRQIPNNPMQKFGQSMF